MLNSLSTPQAILEQAIDRNPLLLPPETPVMSAITAMNQARNSYTLVVKDQQLKGIFTERDVVKITASEMSLEGVALSQVMSHNLITLSLTEVCDIYTVLNRLRTSPIRHIPVINETGHPIGVITPESLRQVLQPTDLLQISRVAEKMAKTVVTAPANASVFQVAQLMAKHRKSCVVICPAPLDAPESMTERPGKPIGIITERDLVKYTSQELDLHQTTAETVMSCPLLAVEIDATLWQAHQIMQEKQIRRLVVVNETGDLAGIITQSSLLHALDPVEMYATVEILQQTIAEKTQELKAVNEQMQQEVWQRQNIEDELRQSKETLEEQVRQRTLEITRANAQLKQEIQDRIAAETQVRQLNAELEQRVKERTAQLAASNQELQQALEHLQATQQELIQSEKMAALGQLIAGVAHEINTPLGAIRSSIENLADFLSHKLVQLPQFLQTLSFQHQQYFFALLQNSTVINLPLSSKEKRQIKRSFIKQLDAYQIANVETVADTLVDIGITENIEQFLPLLQDPEGAKILQFAYQIASLHKSATTIKTATDRAAKIVFALKTYARFDVGDHKVQANLLEGIETVLTLYQSQLKQGVEVIKEYAPNLPELLCYPDELNQVWTNLIHNALQAMNYQGTLKIGALQERDNIIIKITDSGPGISPEILPKIFEPFFTTKPPGKGSGLGLDIVRKIINKHQGKIEVDSRPASTTFTVTIPIESPEN